MTGELAGVVAALDYDARIPRRAGAVLSAADCAYTTEASRL
jgi:hypothetical protein